jgi:hypothetical protein
MKKVDPILFIVFFNIITAILLNLNRAKFIQVDDIYIRFFLFMLFLWNLLLAYFLFKKNKA